ncbi:MAG: UPF0147 family protein [Candidatus Methanofastidiosia archaeon]
MSDKIQNLIDYLQNYVVSDTMVPRNIRRAASNAVEQLRQKDVEDKVKAYSAIELLDEISNDPNMPMHTRTVIWEVLSELEKIE